MIYPGQLRVYPLFAGLSEEEFVVLAHCLTRRILAKGAYLFHPGHPILNMYLVESGLVRVFFNDSRGQEFMLHLIGPGSMVGLPIMRENQTRMLGAAAVAPSVALVIAQQELLRFVQCSPQLNRNIYGLVSAGIEDLLLHVRSLVTLDVNGRLAALFLYLSRDDPKSQREINLPLSQTDLAGWIGVSRGSLNRALNHLQELGLIHMEGQKMIILDRPGLERAAEGLITQSL